MARYEIVDGPSKSDLMLSLFDANRHNLPVSFKVAGWYGDIEAIIITGVGKNGDDRESWLFKGYNCNQFLSEKEKMVNGLFSTQTRKGWIEVYF